MNEVLCRDSPALCSLRGVNQYFNRGALRYSVLRDIELTLRVGDTCAIVGASGSGKSTLLNILGLLERPACGQQYFAGHDLTSASADQLAQVRNRDIGFVFQTFNLLPRLSARDNVALPLVYRNVPRRIARQRALEQLRAVGLEDRAEHLPADLSGGQRQRVAIARALVGEPALILADEPTGNLDQQCADDIMQLLLALNRQQQVTLVMVTHDARLAARFSRRVEVVDGQLREACA
jgi:putative ABC transport system ATP-binding protein